MKKSNRNKEKKRGDSGGKNFLEQMSTNPFMISTSLKLSTMILS